MSWNVGYSPAAAATLAHREAQEKQKAFDDAHKHLTPGTQAQVSSVKDGLQKIMEKK